MVVARYHADLTAVAVDSCGVVVSQAHSQMVCSAGESPIMAVPRTLSLLLQSCRRNLNTVGKPIIIPGLPELAGLVGNMAAQWEAQAEKQAMQTETDGAVEEATGDDDSPAVAADGVEDAAPANRVTSTDDAVQGTASHRDAVETSGAVQADASSAVDANADEPMPDVVGDANASQRVAGVTPDTDAAPSADAVEARRHEKKKAAAKD